MRYKKLRILQYKEGFSYPIEKDVLIDSDSRYNQSLLEREVDKLWVTKKDYGDLMKYVIIGAVVVVGIIIVLNLMKGQSVPGS